MYEILTRCPLFRGLDAGQIKEILDTTDTDVRTYSRGEMVARRDTAYSGLMIILRGSAIGMFTFPSGKSITMEAIEAPELIAPAFLFGGYNRLPIDVVADSDLEILTIHRGSLFALIQDHTIVLSNFIDILSDRTNVWQKKIYALSFRSLKEKLASYLIDHSADGDVVPVPDIKDIAEYFGATRNSLLSVAEGLQKKNILRLENENIRILNREALKDIIML